MAEDMNEAVSAIEHAAEEAHREPWQVGLMRAVEIFVVVIIMVGPSCIAVRV